MASGRKTLSEIEDAIADVRLRERKVQGELEAANQKRAELIEQRTAAFRELALVRTKNALSDGVIDRADRLSHRVSSLLSARQKTVDALKQRLREASNDYDQLIKQSKPVHAKIANLEEELDLFASEARKALLNDREYRELEAHQKALVSMRDKAQKKSVQAREDRERKGRDYESDPLFMYLWNRRYRQQGYKPHAIIKWADDRIAKLVGYSSARADYAVLLEIPQRLFDHVANLDKRNKESQAELDRRLSQKTGEIAGEEFLARLEAARIEENKTNKSIEELSAEMAEISTQLNRYAQGLDPSFLKAVEMSAGFLENTSYQQLVRLARATVEPSDDQIVARISQIDAKSAKLVKDLATRRNDLETLAKRREDLINVAADFRRSHYDQPGSIFVPDSDVSIILEELVKGAISGADYWARTRRRHRWSPRSADPFRRSTGLPPFGGSDFGNTWSGGGDFGTGGGF